MKSDNLVLDNHTQLHDFQEEMGDNHVASSLETPLRDDAFNLSDDEKITKISHHFREIMETIGLDLTDDSLNGTPKRVAKMFVKEIFKGLNPENKPAATMFENKFGYNQMLVEKNVSIFSTCEHHFLPIYGFAHIAYMSSGQVIGLSKLNRIVQYYAKRPQVQERLTMQVVQAMQEALGVQDVACVIDAKHLCVNSRGIKDIESSTITSEFGGKFKDKNGTWVMKNKAAKEDLPTKAVPGNCYAKCLPAEGDETTSEWVHVVCPSVKTESYMNKITKTLASKGYTVGIGAIKKENAKHHSLDATTRVALLKFQKDNKLSSGQLTAETVKLLGLPVKTEE